MKTRITKKHVTQKVAELNKSIGFTQDSEWNHHNGRNVSTIGMFIHSKAYGGNQIARIVNESGGEETITSGFVTPRECLAALDKRIANGLDTLSLNGYLYQCIDLSEYDRPDTLLNLKEIFESEKPQDGQRGYAQRCEDWLRGMASACSIEHRDNEIIAMSERYSWGFSTPDEYWRACAVALVAMMRQA